MRRGALLAVLLAAIGASSQAEATPLECLPRIDGSPSFAERLEKGIRFARDRESFQRLRDRARNARDDGWTSDRIRREEALDLANAALICAPHTANFARPEDTRQALIYLAALALNRHMTDPLASASARDTARRLLETTDPQHFNVTRDGAKQEVEAMRRAAEAVIGAAAGEARPLRERVDAQMARMTSLGGSPILDDHLKAMQEPVRERLKVLVDVALTRESARNLIAIGVGRSCARSGENPDSCAEEDLSLLSDGERRILDHLRSGYLSVFQERAIPVLAQGAAERLTNLRETLQKRGLEAEELKGFCVTRSLQGGEAPCLLNEGGLLLSSGQPYPAPEIDPSHRKLTDLVPLRLLDAEARRAVDLVLKPLVQGFGGQTAQGTIAFLEALAAYPRDKSPGLLNEYGSSRMDASAFKMSGRLNAQDFCAPAAPSEAPGPHLATGEAEAKRARATVESFVSEREASGEDLVRFCGMLKTLAAQTSGERR